MERIPNGRYTQEFREEVVKMTTDGPYSILRITHTGRSQFTTKYGVGAALKLTL